MAGIFRRAVEYLQEKHSGVSRGYVVSCDGTEDVEGVSSQQTAQAVAMFRIRTLAIVLRCFTSILAVIQMALITWVVFTYYNDSNCLTKCRTFHDHPYHNFRIPEWFYDSDDPLLKPFNATGNDTTEYDYDDRGLMSPRTPLSGAFRKRYWPQDGFKLWNEDEVPHDLVETFKKCQAQCDEVIMPLQGPLMIYVIHCCLSIGFLLKTTYSSYGDYLVVRLYDVVEGILLAVALILLIAVKVNNREKQDSDFIRYAYHQDTGEFWFNGSMLWVILVGTACFVLHVAEAINHRSPPRTVRFPNPNEGEESFCYRRLNNFWFPRLLKLVRCVVAVGGTAGLAIYIFHGLYVDNRDRWHYDYHIDMHMSLSFPAIAWHAAICCLIGSWNGRYLTQTQIQVELAFYVIELLHLALLAVYHCGNLVAKIFYFYLNIDVPSIVIALINFVVWIFDFGVRRFPGHECCNQEPF